MIEAPDSVRRYESAKSRFLRSSIINFFERELPKLFGPVMREKLADELIALFCRTMPEKSHVKPGQVVWNALHIRTRGDSPNRRFVPVILTLVDEKDCQMLSDGAKMYEIASRAVARITREAYEQGGLLSMRDIGLLTWRVSTTVSRMRINYEREEKTALPHTGNLHDMGSCVSHKNTIIEKVIVDKKDPLQVARETNHSLTSVERYVKDFKRVQACYDKHPDIAFVSNVTGISKHVVKTYVSMFR